MKAAEAEAESKYLSGVGVSRQRKAIVDGLRDSVQTFSDTIDGAWCGDKEIAQQQQQHRRFLFYLACISLFSIFSSATFYFIWWNNVSLTAGEEEVYFRRRQVPRVGLRWI